MVLLSRGGEQQVLLLTHPVGDELARDLARRARFALLAGAERARLSSEGGVRAPERAALVVALEVRRGSGPLGARIETAVAAGAGRASRDLARAVRGALATETELAAGRVREASDPLLAPAGGPETPACRAELWLSDERELGAPGRRARTAAALARTLESFRVASGDGPPRERRFRLPGGEGVRADGEHFDLWHEVPLVPQRTGMNCWAAAAAMVIGWRDQLPLETEEIFPAPGGASSPRGAAAHEVGLEPRDVAELARTWGLVVEPPRTYTVASLRELLSAHGPLWVGQADPDLHVIVVAGMHGDGSPAGTRVRINDPWPIGRGERYNVSFRELAQRFQAAKDLAGIHAQVLHAGARRGGGSRLYTRSTTRRMEWSTAR
ncbi:MAG: papain-like cysteine protease family protein [Planctomycetota bacterium]